MLNKIVFANRNCCAKNICIREWTANGSILYMCKKMLHVYQDGQFYNGFQQETLSFLEISTNLNILSLQMSPMSERCQTQTSVRIHFYEYQHQHQTTDRKMNMVDAQSRNLVHYISLSAMRISFLSMLTSTLFILRISIYSALSEQSTIRAWYYCTYMCI